MEIKNVYSDIKQELKDESWFVLDNSSKNGLKLVFVNNDELPKDYKCSNFEEFCESYLDDNLHYFENSTRKLSNNFAQAICYTSIPDDEQFGSKVLTVFYTDAQIISIHNGIELNKIKDLVSQSKFELKELEAEGNLEAKDSYLQQKDPYAYYGVNKKSFF